MQNILTIIDETAIGKELNRKQINISEENLSVAEIIRQRVFHEVEYHNQALQDTPQAKHINPNTLIQIGFTEDLLNTNVNKEVATSNVRKLVDPEKQYYLALKAFSENKFFLIINDKQVENLEQIIQIRGELSATFVKLTPLVGG